MRDVLKSLELMLREKRRNVEIKSPKMVLMADGKVPHSMLLPALAPGLCTGFIAWRRDYSNGSNGNLRLREPTCNVRPSLVGVKAKHCYWWPLRAAQGVSRMI